MQDGVRPTPEIIPGESSDPGPSLHCSQSPQRCASPRGVAQESPPLSLLLAPE